MPTHVPTSVPKEFNVSAWKFGTEVIKMSKKWPFQTIFDIFWSCPALSCPLIQGSTVPLRPAQKTTLETSSKPVPANYENEPERQEGAAAGL